MSKHWLLAPQKSNDLFEQLLINRGIKKSDWSSFLNPNFERDRGKPMLLKGMSGAVERIVKAIEKNELIGIFADYDADGIPAAAIVYQTVRFLSQHRVGQSVQTPVYIPSREEGYGLNKKGIDWLIQQGASLLVTLDLGVKSKQEIEYARSQGLDCIVVDHHLVGDDLPEDAIIINPKQASDRYPFKDFSAGGLAWKLAEALLNISELSNTPEVKKNDHEAFLKWLLDLAAISTICDMVPLLGENRLIVKYGLMVLRKSRRVGLQAMYKTVRIKPETIDTYHVGFLIGPRINAPGRMDHASPAFYCLVSSDPIEARSLASRLNEINHERQLELERVLAEAKEQVFKDKLHERKVILVAGENWPSGIVGLVAGKLMEEFTRPTIVLSKEEKYARGSARSVETFHIVEAFDHASRFLTKYGGHAKAAGLTVENEHLTNLYDLLLEYAEQKLTDEDLLPTITIDAKIEAKQISLTLVDQLKQLEPHGIGNPRPVILIEKLRVGQVRQVGKEGSHVKLTLCHESQGILSAVYFNGSDRLPELRVGQTIDCVATLHEDTWGGGRRVDCHLIDFKKV